MMTHKFTKNISRMIYALPPATSFIAMCRQYSIAEGRNDSPGGRNVLFVLRRYQCPPSFSVSNIFVDQVVHTHVLKGYNKAQLCVSKFLFELISIRDNVLRFPVDFYPFDIAALIAFVCTS